MMAELNQWMSDTGVYRHFGRIVGVLVAGIVGLIWAVAKLVEWMTALHHLCFVGNSPSLLSVFGMLASAVTAVGDAFQYPIQMIGKLITGLKDIASLLAGKALGFISGAVSAVFGGSPQSQVNNASFSRKEDMESVSSSIGEEVAKAVKEALQGVQMNSKVEVEVTSQNGLPSLFDYVQKGLDDVSSGRPANHALNARRAGIG